MGPLWCYWEFVMERFCGSLLPAVKSRKHPYTSLARRVRDIAQLSQIKLIYGLFDALDLSDRKSRANTAERINDCKSLKCSPCLAFS